MVVGMEDMEDGEMVGVRRGEREGKVRSSPSSCRPTPTVLRAVVVYQGDPSLTSRYFAFIGTHPEL